MGLIEYDNYANAIYVRLTRRKSKIKKTVPLGKGTYVDVGTNGKPIGVEVILPKPMTEVATKILYEIPNVLKNQ